MSGDEYTPLEAYFMAFPLKARREKRKLFSESHGITQKQSHHFAKRHPKRLDAIRITEKFTEYQVTRFDLFPDLYDKQEIISLIQKVQND